MDASLRGLQLQLYAFEDAADAAKKLADVQADGAAKVSDARQLLADAYDRESSALKDTADNFKSIADSLKAYGASLSGAGDASASPLAAYKAASQAFKAVAAAAKTGDVAGLNSLQGVSDAFLQAAKDVAPDAKTYARALADVRIAVQDASGTATDQASIAEQQLQALNDQVGGLIEVNKSVLSVTAAINNLAQIVAQTSAATAAAIPPPAPIIPDITPTVSPANDPARPADFSAYVDQNPDLLNLFNSHTGMAKGRTKEQFGEYHWANYGSKEPGRIGPVGFKDGGVDQIGGWGGTDSQLMQFRATPGEFASVGHVDPFAAIEGLRSEIQGLRQDLQYSVGAVAANTRKTAGTLNRWEGGGMPPERDAA
jgi:hypothetical protein